MIRTREGIHRVWKVPILPFRVPTRIKPAIDTCSNNNNSRVALIRAQDAAVGRRLSSLGFLVKLVSLERDRRVRHPLSRK